MDTARRDTRHRLCAALGAAILTCGLAACTASTGPSGSTTRTPSSGSTAGGQPGSAGGGPTGVPATPTPVPTPTPTPSDPLAGWDLAEEVGQLFMVGVDVTKQQDSAWAAVREDHVGNVFIAGRSHAAPANVEALVRSFTDLVSPDTTHSTPMLVATDQEGGNVQVLQGPGFSTIPSALEQGRMDVGTLRSEATTWGAELASAGITLNLAPVMDLVDGDAAANAPIGHWDRQYGADADTIVAHADAFAAGMRASGVMVAPKHFPGLGRVSGNTDVSADVHDTHTTSDDAAVDVFRRGIEAGARVVMVSSAVYDRIDAAHPAVFSPVVVTDLLRGDLGFSGVVITDDLSRAAQVQAWTPGERAVSAIEAGCDIVLVSAAPEVAQPMVETVLAKAQVDPAFAATVHAAAARVVALKEHVPEAEG